jgi:hypothetical protein
VPATILTVLRSGGEYTWQHVARLEKQCRKYAPDARFHCLHDDLMLHGWPGWFAKIEMFRLRGPMLYMDLDTTIRGDLTPLLDAATQHDFIALRNPYPTPSQFGSGLMAWRGDMAHIYDRFAADAEFHIKRCTTQAVWGDQGFIAEDVRNPVLWQDLFPGEIVSWKAECKQGVPEHARVIYFHGTPRPWAVGM